MFYPHLNKRPFVDDGCLQLHIQEFSEESAPESRSVKQLYTLYHTHSQEEHYSSRELYTLEEQFTSLQKLAKALEAAYNALSYQSTTK